MFRPTPAGESRDELRDNLANLHDDKMSLKARLRRARLAGREGWASRRKRLEEAISTFRQQATEVYDVVLGS